MAVTVLYEKWEHRLLLTLPMPGVPFRFDRLVWHWSAGTYDRTYADYHVCVLGPPKDGLLRVTHDLKANMKAAQPGADYAAHTWRLNSFSLGVSAMAMRRAVAKAAGGYDFGDQPLTRRQIEALAWLGAMAHVAYAVPFDMMWTHHEAYRHFIRQGIVPRSFRWDLKVLSPDSAQNGGDVLRAKAAWYAANDPNLLDLARRLGD